MASVSKVVNISVSLLTAGVKEAGFGIPLIADYHTHFAERVRFYDPTDLSAMVTDGFATSDAAYQAVAAVGAQQPTVPLVAVGRRALAPTIKVNLAPTLALGKSFAVKATDKNGLVTTVAYACTTDKTLSYDAQSANFTVGLVVTGGTSGAKGTIVADTDGGATGTLRLSGVTGTFQNDEALTDSGTGAATVNGTAADFETVAKIVTGLTSVIDALANISAAEVSATSIDVTATTAGNFFTIEVLDDSGATYAGFNYLAANQTHADPGIATDLAAIAGADSSWYGLTLTTQGKDELDAASAWAESNAKQFIQASQDGAILAATSGNVMKLAQTASRARTGYIFHQNPKQHAGAAWMGSVFSIDPGAVTYAFRQLRNVDKSNLTPTHIANIEAANGNYFVDIGGHGITLPGKTASGEWLDIIRDLDWYEVQIGVEHLLVKLNNNKVPMTNAGIAMEETALRTATKRAVAAGFLDGDSVTYTVPDVLEISANKRALRTLDKLRVSARVQGAIHITNVVATITS